MIDVLSIFTLIGITLLLGYICSIIFKKTQIPDVIWLLMFGYLIGPVFNLVSRELFVSMAPLLASFSLLIILFDAGLEMNISQAVKQFPRIIFLSFFSITLTILVIAAASIFLFNFDWVRALLLGSIIGGPSSAIVVSILKKLNVREEIRTILDLESIITDPVDVVLTLALIQFYTSTLPFNSIFVNLTSAFSLGAIFGLVISVIWILFLRQVKSGFNYMLTLGILLLTYALVESISGSGAVAALVFGAVLGSEKISNKLKFKEDESVEPPLKKFHEEITFFVRSFFFVSMGIIVSINYNFILQGIVITAFIALARIVSVKICTYKMNLSSFESNIMKINIPQGLATAVMAYVPSLYGIKDAEVFVNIAFVVILATIIYTTIGIKLLYIREKNY